MLIRCKFLSSKWVFIRRSNLRKFSHSSRISTSKSLSSRGLLCLFPGWGKTTTKFPLAILQSANYVNSIHDDDAVIPEDDDTVVPEYDDDSADSAASNPFFNDALRQKLYPKTTDPLLLSLVEANSVQEIYSILDKVDLNEEHVSQAIVSLWDLQKFLHHFPPNLLKGLSDVPIAPSFKINRKILNEFIEVVNSHPQFSALVKAAGEMAPSMSSDALASVLFCLKQFRVSIDSDPSGALYSLLFTSLNRIHEFPFTALSKWCLTVSNWKPAGRLMITAALPLIELKMKQCETTQDIKFLSVCFITIEQFVDDHLSKSFTQLVTDLLDSNVINLETSISVIIKILRTFIQAPHTTYQFSSEPIRRILSLLECSSQMNDFTTYSGISIYWVKRAIDLLGEPTNLTLWMEEKACRMLERVDIDHYPTYISLLACITKNASRERKNHVEHCLWEILQQDSLHDPDFSLKVIFMTLRQLQSSDPKLTDAFWAAALKHASNPCNSAHSITRICNWYLLFNFNLAGTCRNKSFENEMLKSIYDEMDNWKGTIPYMRIFFRFASFIIAFGNSSQRMDIFPKLIDYKDQLKISDIHPLSRGLQAAHHFSNLSQTGHSHYPDLVDLSIFLHQLTLRSLSSDPSVREVSSLLKSVQCRKGFSSSQGQWVAAISDAAFSKINPEEFTGRLIRNFASYLSWAKYLPIEVVDNVLDYALKEHSQLSPEILAKVASLFFDLGYAPPQLHTFLPIVTDILSREITRIRGLLMIYYALTLLLHNTLPIRMVNDILSVSFLEKLDDEIESSFSKASYPPRVRQMLMELNRSVCIDMPEADIPWFHEKYCLEQRHMYSPRFTTFHRDVHRCLNQLLGSDKFIRCHTHSPYHHNIDFELLIDGSGNPITYSDQSSTESLEKVAILPLLPGYFTTNRHNLLGIHQLRHRHLEVLGYRVIGIPYRHWNSLTLSSTQNKCTYLSHKLNIEKS